MTIKKGVILFIGTLSVAVLRADLKGESLDYAKVKRLLTKKMQPDSALRLLLSVSLPIVLCALYILFPFYSLARAEEAYLSIAYYPLARDGAENWQDAPVNGVIRFPQKLLEHESCVAGLAPVKGDKIDQIKIAACRPDTRHILKECGDLVQQFFAGFDGWKKIAVLELEKTERAFLYLARFEGGPGGEQHNWSLYSVNSKTPYCPEKPFLSGIEIAPGGKVWKEEYCRTKESYENCLERVLYSKRYAVQILFTRQGIAITRPLPANTPNPRHLSLESGK